MKDLVDESDLYYKVDTLIDVLSNWDSSKFETLELAYLDIVKQLVHAKIFGSADLRLAYAWCADLNKVGYKWPQITGRMTPWKVPSVPIVDERHISTKSSIIRKNVVCIIGELHEDALHSIRANVLDVMDADLIIISTEQGGESRFDFNETYNAFVLEDGYSLKDFFDEEAPRWRESTNGNHLGGLPNHSDGHGAFQLKDRWMCEKYIEKLEQNRSSPYEFLGVGRADLVWLLPHPRVNPDGCWIPCVQNDWGGLCDHWAWCARPNGKIYLTAPLKEIPLLETGVWSHQKHLKFALMKNNVSVDRGNAAFFRLCADEKPHCGSVFYSNTGMPNMKGKTSGSQLEVAKDQLLEHALSAIGYT